MTLAPVRRRSSPRRQLGAAAPVPQVRVELTLAGGRRTSLGSADAAVRDLRLTPGERLAVQAVLHAVELLRQRTGFAGIGAARSAVRLVLRDADASTGGPWATTGSLAVGARNALADRAGERANPGVLITVDTALHELAHVIQFETMGPSAKPNGAILEGIADAVAMLATGDDTLGEGFFRRDAAGRYRGAVRELGTPRTSGPSVGPIVTTYTRANGAEEHAAGGVVSTAFRDLRASLGRDRAEQLLWTVIRDRPAWASGGSWRELVAAMRRAAGGDAAVAAAVERALRVTELDRA